MSMFCSTGQNTGSEAQIVATSTSRAARTIGVGPYQVGSNLQYPESASVKSISVSYLRRGGRGSCFYNGRKTPYGEDTGPTEWLALSEYVRRMKTLQAADAEQADQRPSGFRAVSLVVQQQWRRNSKDDHVENHIGRSQARISGDECFHLKRTERISCCGKCEVPVGLNRNCGHPAQNSIG